MTVYVADADMTLYHGDALDVLRGLPPGSVHCCITSPPYWGLRDYGSEGQLGLEPTPDEYVSRLVDVFREVRRVLRDDGTCWVNLGSSYMNSGASGPQGSTGQRAGRTFTAAGLGSGAVGASGRSQSRPPYRAPAYGSDGTTPQDSTAPDSAYRDLCDECLADYLSHRDRIAGTRQLPSLAAQPPAPTDRDTAPGDSEPSSPDASPLDAQASTTIESWRLLRGPCSRCDSRASSLSGARSSSPDAPGFARNSWLNYTRSLKAKDLVPIPWMVAMALQQDGWYLRADIIWSKPNPMPESVTDRPTKAHEYVFLLTKSSSYFFDADAVREPLVARPQQRLTATKDQPLAAARIAAGVQQGNLQGGTHANRFAVQDETLMGGQPMDTVEVNDWSPTLCGCVEAGCGQTFDVRDCGCACHASVGRNVRSVWEIAAKPYPGPHFAVFPQELARRCIAAGTSERGCCPDCGAPWERETEVTGQSKQRNNKRPDYDGGSYSKEARTRPVGATSSFKTGLVAIRETLGWRPPCTHNRDPVACTVLDPFAGSATTGLVARKLGRRSILVELSADYCRLAADRLSQLSLLAGVLDG